MKTKYTVEKNDKANKLILTDPNLSKHFRNRQHRHLSNPTFQCFSYLSILSGFGDKFCLHFNA